MYFCNLCKYIYCTYITDICKWLSLNDPMTNSNWPMFRAKCLHPIIPM